MIREEFIQEVLLKYRENSKFAFDLDTNIKQKKLLLEILNNIPTDILNSVTWVKVNPNNFECRIHTTTFLLVCKKKQVCFTFYGSSEIDTLFSGYNISIPRENFSKYSDDLLEMYYKSILDRL